jgi:NADPH:quinone reductase-like Zn-dependent oxidoreductase
MSRVVVATAFGGPEVLSVVEEPAGTPGPGEVLLEVRAAGVNPADWKAVSGAWGADPSRLPLRLGYEVAGVVTAVGPDADGAAGPVSVGDEVIAQPVQGGYASELVVRAADVVPKPAALGWAEAGGLLLTGTTAAHAVTAVGVTSGDTLLVHGAAGGVGQAAVQLAVERGARVIGTAGPSSAELLRRLGAEPVAYGDGLADRVREAAPDGVTAAIDAIGTDEALDVSLDLVADRQRIATVANFARAAKEGVQVLGNGPGADPGTDVRRAARLELVRLAEEGRLQVAVEATFALEDAASAHRRGMAGHSHGKLVLLP